MKKYLLIVCIALGSITTLVSKAHGQAALLVLLFGDKIATEKFHLSIDAGVNIASLPGLTNQKSAYGLYFGLGTYIKLSDKWALTPEFKPVSPRGAKAVLPLRDYSSVLTDVSYDIALKYIDVPVLAQYKITPQLFVGAGPQLSFLTLAKQLATGNLPAGNPVDIQEKMKSNFQSVYFSVPLEIGYSLSDSRKGKGMDIKLRYNIGASQILSAPGYGSSQGSTLQLFLSFPFVNQ